VEIIISHTYKINWSMQYVNHHWQQHIHSNLVYMHIIETNKSTNNSSGISSVHRRSGARIHPWFALGLAPEGIFECRLPNSTTLSCSLVHWFKFECWIWNSHVCHNIYHINNPFEYLFVFPWYLLNKPKIVSIKLKTSILKHIQTWW
jgi:hypothetical protein